MFQTHAKRSNKQFNGIAYSKSNVESPCIPNLTINLKQWQILLAVIEEGNFSTAANRLNVTQPAISYTIAKMEEQLGMRLLRIEGRKAELTESGQVLAALARRLLLQAAALEDKAETIRRSVRPQLRLAIEKGFPVEMIVPVLRDFINDDRHARVNLAEYPKEELETKLHSDLIDLAITSQVTSGFEVDQLIEVKHIAVARPNHVLHQLNRTLDQEDLEREVQVVTEHNWPQEEAHFRSGNRWKVNSVETALSIVLEGLGFAWLPLHMILGALYAKKLVPLRLVKDQIHKSNFYLVKGNADSLDAASLSTALKHITSDERYQTVH